MDINIAIFQQTKGSLRGGKNVGEKNAINIVNRWPPQKGDPARPGDKDLRRSSETRKNRVWEDVRWDAGRPRKPGDVQNRPLLEVKGRGRGVQLKKRGRNCFTKEEEKKKPVE